MPHFVFYRQQAVRAIITPNPNREPHRLYKHPSTMKTLSLKWLFLLPALALLAACSNGNEADQGAVAEAQEVNDERFGEDDIRREQGETLIGLANAQMLLSGAANLYLTQGQNPELKRLATEMDGVQSALQPKLRQLAEARGIILPTAPGLESQDALNNFMKADSPAELDEEFVMLAERGHEMVAEAASALSNTDYPAELREFSAELQAYVQAHQLILQGLEE